MAVVASTESSVRPAVQPRAIVFAGLVALAVAMGIGRFAFTPLLPMMLHDGVVNLPAASWLASASKAFSPAWLRCCGVFAAAAVVADAAATGAGPPKIGHTLATSAAASTPNTAQPVAARQSSATIPLTIKPVTAIPAPGPM